MASQLNVDSIFNAAGTGTPSIQGTATNDSAAAGKIGEVLTANRLRSNLSSDLSNGNTANVLTAALSLTAGDWDVTAFVGYNFSVAATVTRMIIGISQSSGTLPPASTIAYNDPSSVESAIYWPTAIASTTAEFQVAHPTIRVKLSATTPYYLVTNVSFSAGTIQCYGSIWARRAR